MKKILEEEYQVTAIHTLRLCKAHTAPGVERGRDKDEKSPLLRGTLIKNAYRLAQRRVF